MSAGSPPVARAERFEQYKTLTTQEQAQTIVDNLLLGPLQIAENEDDLLNLNISAILSILGFEQNENFGGGHVVERKWLCVEDRVEAGPAMRAALAEGVATIHSWIHADRRVVYVHCQSGISRSATVVIAYLMKHHNMALIDAYRHVYEARPVMHCLLQQYH